MIIINDKSRGDATNIKILQKQITGYIKNYRKNLDSEKCFPDIRTETLDLIAYWESQLRYLTEMQKIPFDVLIVIEKEEVSYNETKNNQKLYM